MLQVAEKFLERDELASMSFQNDFLTPFVVVMRQSGAKEIRELIIRQASRMVLSRVSNIKSGWKSMFMVTCCYISRCLLGLTGLAPSCLIAGQCGALAVLKRCISSPGPRSVCCCPGTAICAHSQVACCSEHRRSTGWLLTGLHPFRCSLRLQRTQSQQS